MAEVNCVGKTTREINVAIKGLIEQGEVDLLVQEPAARHNLAVAILNQARITFDGSVGYYCGGMMDGASIDIQGSAGWGLAESMLNGTVVVQGNAGNGAAASIRGGTVVIHGDAAARLGVAMKGGLILVGGDCGYMAGFMGQKGTMIICGDTGHAFADSMYETTCFVGGEVAELGNDAVIEVPSSEDQTFLEVTLAEHLPEHLRKSPEEIKRFKKIVSGRKLWNFDKSERSLWREAL